MKRRQEAILFQSYSSMSRKDNREQRREVVNKLNIIVKLYRELMFSTIYFQL